MRAFMQRPSVICLYCFFLCFIPRTGAFFICTEFGTATRTHTRTWSMSPNAADAADATATVVSDITIRAITADQPDMKVCYSVRRKVFIEEQQVPAEIEMDANDKTATHILATAGDDNTPVGAARIVYVDDGKVGKIGRVCVHSEHRGKGIGRQIVLFCVDQIRKEVGVNSGGKAKLGSQVHALEFYKSMGFQLTDREKYMDGGNIPHRDMVMHL